MGPDWFTVIAQIINFLVLVALLKRFLYGPIVRAMVRREAEITARFEDAAKKADDARQERERYESLMEEFAKTREVMRVEAREEADTLRKELLAKAREEVARSRTQWLESFRRERDSLFRSLRRHVCEQVCAVSRGILTDMADASLEERMAACLEQRIRDLGTERREELAGHFRIPGQEVVVRSAFEMSTEARRKVIKILESLDADTGTVRFEVEPSLICGIDMRAGGRSLAWNLEEHLGDLEDLLVEKMADSVPGESGRNDGGSERRIDEHGS